MLTCARQVSAVFLFGCLGELTGCVIISTTQNLTFDNDFEFKLKIYLPYFLCNALSLNNHDFISLNNVNYIARFPGCFDHADVAHWLVSGYYI